MFSNRISLSACCLLLVTGCDYRASEVAKQQPSPTAQSSTTGAKQDGAKHDEWADHTQGLPFVFGYDRGMAEAKSQSKPVMLFVTTTWCGWCKKLAEEDFNDPEIRKLLSEKFVLAIVDGDTESGPAAKLGAQGFPYIVFQDPAGNKIGVCEGYKPAKEFKPLVESALAQAKSAT